jgi:hypothetical protein
VLVLDPNNEPTTRLLLDRPGTRLVFHSSRTVVATRQATSAPSPSTQAFRPTSPTRAFAFRR